MRFLYHDNKMLILNPDFSPQMDGAILLIIALMAMVVERELLVCSSSLWQQLSEMGTTSELSLEIPVVIRMGKRWESLCQAKMHKRDLYGKSTSKLDLTSWRPLT